MGDGVSSSSLCFVCYVLQSINALSNHGRQERKKVVCGLQIDI
jgi:hypothetical protein